MLTRLWEVCVMYDRLPETEALVLYVQAGIIVKEHRVFASGRHGIEVVNFDKLRENAPEVFDRSCFELASRLTDEQIDYVLGPAEGGNPIAQSVAGFLSAMSPGLTSRISWVPTEKDELLMPLVNDRYLELLDGARVFLVDDVLNHGTTIRELMRLLKIRGIQIYVVGVGVFWTRSAITARDLRVPIIHTIVRRPIQDWPKSECPLCNQGIPTVNPRPPASRHWV